MNMNLLIFFSLSLCILLIFPRQTLQINTHSSEVVEIVAQNITSNLAEWENDFALVFYAPWCQYCKQMLNVWESVAKATKNRRNLVIGKFNCEGNSLQTDICQEFGVDRYPSIFFIGYSKFYQAPTSNPFGKSKYPRVVKYTADLYPEAIYDWLLFLHSVGSISRKWNNIWGRLFGKSSDSKRIRELRSMNDALVKKVELFSAELQKYKAIELFDSLDDYGDPFPVLHEETPEDGNYPFRKCIVEMAGEYCKYFPSESYCLSLPSCSEHVLTPLSCRPAKCPFENQRGCVVVSTCMKPEVQEHYKTRYVAD